ncbi:MAG: DUF5009 domain-containing protein [Sphingobacteriaceae bacterium]
MIVSKETKLLKEVKRIQSLDALRGLAILLMVLSSSIAFGGILPAWMYHAQVPPPQHLFRPDLPGITWVDLVFPFFLFSMGAALPLTLSGKLKSGSKFLVILQILKRYALLVVFALFTVHARAWIINSSPGVIENLISISAFALLFFIYGSDSISKKSALLIQLIGLTIAIAFLAFYPFSKGFSFSTIDVIILVLATMALFGSLIWIATPTNPWLRIGILPFVMAVFLASTVEGSWNNQLFNWTPVSWLYKFYYLKYLFIIIPGTFAGEWLLQNRGKQFSQSLKSNRNKSTDVLTIILTWLILIGNLVCLFERWLLLNLVITSVLSFFLIYVSKQTTRKQHKADFLKFVQAGVYMLLLGLSFEAYEGGIKKDFSTYSYYFVSSGLAFLVLFSFMRLEQLSMFTKTIRFLADAGKNPMIAYTAGNLLLLPLLKMTGFDVWLDNLGSNLIGGFFRGILFTGIVAIITIFFTRKQLFWRT